jgi:nucleotide-binding universal stress UspA family protein
VKSSKPILVLTDVSPESDAAMEFAGNLARLLGATLHVVYAMRLIGRPLRAVVPVLSNISRALGSVDGAMREQIERTIHPSVQVDPPIIDMNDGERALDRAVRQVNPMVVVTSTLNAAVATCPVLVIRERRMTSHDRVAVITTIDAFSSETIEAAGRWAFWMEQAHECRGAPGGPRFVVGLLDEDSSRDHVSKAINTKSTDLIVIDSVIFQNDELAERRNALMNLLAQRKHTPVAFLANETVASPLDPQPKRSPAPLSAA